MLGPEEMEIDKVDTFTSAGPSVRESSLVAVHEFKVHSTVRLVPFFKQLRHFSGKGHPPVLLPITTMGSPLAPHMSPPHTRCSLNIQTYRRRQLPRSIHTRPHPVLFGHPPAPWHRETQPQGDDAVRLSPWDGGVLTAPLPAKRSPAVPSASTWKIWKYDGLVSRVSIPILPPL